jgi:hypothetical protein
MVLSFQTNWFGIADIMDNLDSLPGFTYSVAVSGKDFLIASGVKICKSSAKLNLFPIKRYRAVCSTAAGFYRTPE